MASLKVVGIDLMYENCYLHPARRQSGFCQQAKPQKSLCFWFNVLLCDSSPECLENAIIPIEVAPYSVSIILFPSTKGQRICQQWLIKAPTDKDIVFFRAQNVSYNTKAFPNGSFNVVVRDGANESSVVLTNFSNLDHKNIEEKAWASSGRFLLVKYNGIGIQPQYMFLYTSKFAFRAPFCAVLVKPFATSKLRDRSQQSTRLRTYDFVASINFNLCIQCMFVQKIF